MDERTKVEKYAAQSLHYLKNASKFIDEGNTEKASEFLWGSMAQALKAVAATNGIYFRSHALLWNYAESLAKERGDKSIYDAFSHANSLHKNFYEADIKLKDVRIMGEEIREVVGKLLNLITDKKQGQGS